jgi:hypothetical protein
MPDAVQPPSTASPAAQARNEGAKVAAYIAGTLAVFSLTRTLRVVRAPRARTAWLRHVARSGAEYRVARGVLGEDEKGGSAMDTGKARAPRRGV